MTDADDATRRLLDKLREFASGLDPDERQVLAALVGPGVAMAHREDDEVEAFGMSWEPRRLPERLADAVRDRNITVTGL